MSLEVAKSALEGVLVFRPLTVFEDFRGTYVETFNLRLYRQSGITMEFVQDCISVSHRNVLRGIHGDRTTWKLVSCLQGRFYLVVVNNDESSPEFRKWTSFVLSEQNRLQVLVPPRFGNGHLVLSETAIFHYKQSTYYDRASQFTLMWDDASLGIRWPVRDPVLSGRDRGEP